MGSCFFNIEYSPQLSITVFALNSASLAIEAIDHIFLDLRFGQETDNKIMWASEY